MENNLAILITYFEEEKERLLQMMKDYIEDDEYEFAHFHSLVLQQVNNRLNVLKNFEDKYYDDKSRIKKMISFYEKELKSEAGHFPSSYVTEQLSKEKEMLDWLNEFPKQEYDPNHRVILDEVFVQLLERKIKSFRLILNRSENLYFEFKYYRKVLKVTLPSVKRHANKFVFGKSQIRSFQQMGFELIDNGNTFVLKLTGNKEGVLSQIKTILSKIIFEIFYYKVFERESYIQIN